MKRFSKTIKGLSEPKILMVRHGHTSLNGTDKSEDRIRGWKDVALNDEGRQDAVNAAKDLEKYKDPYAMYSSDLIRAAETAEIIDKTNNYQLPIIHTDTLRPWSLGSFEGMMTKTIIDKLNNMVRNEDIIPHEGEAFKTFRTRFLTEMKKIIDEAVRRRRTIIVVSHFRNLKTLDAWLHNGAPDDLSIDTEVMIKDSFKPGEVFDVPLTQFMKGKE